MAPTRTLILMRHAKSAYPDDVRDHDRPLAVRGQREAALAGDWVRATVLPVDEVLCSSALRTGQTAAAMGLRAPIRRSPEIYDAEPADILDQIRTTATDVVTLLVIGHAPGMPGVALLLSGDGSDQQAVNGLVTGFPTAALAVVETECDWPDLEVGGARLTSFHVARA